MDNAQLVGRTTPRLLFAGPPGNGQDAERYRSGRSARRPGGPLLGEILDQWVGVAERNMARANQVLRAMAAASPVHR